MHLSSVCVFPINISIIYLIFANHGHAIRLEVDDFFFQGNSKYFNNFTRSVNTNTQGVPVINVKFNQKFAIQKCFVRISNFNILDQMLYEPSILYTNSRDIFN